MSHLVKCPILAKVLEVHVKVGDAVSAHTVIATLEAGEREIKVEAEAAGTVSTVLTVEGATHKKDEILVFID